MTVPALNKILADRGLAPVTGETADRFERFAALLLEKNRLYNLTAIESEEAVAERHFADSLSIFLDPEFRGGRMLDLGCGGGFPGIPVKLYADGKGIPLEILLMDSTAKKIDFVRETIGLLGISGAKAVARRAEESVEEFGRETFDLITARAVSDMRVISELAFPYLRVGGIFYAWKTRKAIPEVEDAIPTVKLLGGKEEGRFFYGEGVFFLEKCVKIAPTPARFPRKYAQIVKKKP